MCIVIIALHQHPSYPLIIASNRDEFRARPCRASSWWSDGDGDDDDPSTSILAGKDMKESGTWLGITKSGRIACITNYRDMKNRQERTDATSRGKLVVQYLKEETTPNDFMKHFLGPDDACKYNGFNLLLGQLSMLSMDLNWCSNVKNSNDTHPSSAKISEPPPLLQQHLETGIHVISNAHLNTPWLKSERLRKHLTQIIHPSIHNNSAIELTNRIFQALQDSEPAQNDDDLPDTGIGLEWERLLSSIFVNTPAYGTVCSTVILIDTHQTVRWEERSYDASGTVSSTAIYEFQLTHSG